MICIRNGNIHNAIVPEAFVAGKIKEIGSNLAVPEGTELIDASGKEIYPGFVEAHGHIGLDGHPRKDHR
mgnify:CR=1 FL=1